MPIVAPERITEIVSALRSGEIVAIPTDTVYGLAALPDNEAALRRLAALKGRPEGQPFAVLVDSLDAVISDVENGAALETVAPFWPGPLTVVVGVRAGFAQAVVTAKGTLGFRQPDDMLTRELIRRCGGVLAVTSANRTGEPPAEHAAEVAAIFGKTLLVLDGGPRSGRPPSTVIDLTVDPPAVLREGAIDAAAVLASLAAR